MGSGQRRTSPWTDDDREKIRNLLESQGKSQAGVALLWYYPAMGGNENTLSRRTDLAA